jgi:hypothetical protein
MWDNVCGRHIRRTNRRLLLAGLALGLITATLTFCARRYLYNVVFGPFPLDATALAEVSDPGERWEYFVTVRAAGVRPFVARGYTGGRPTPYSTYAFLPGAGQELLLRVPAGQAGPELTGPLERLSDFERDQLLEPLRRAGSPDGRRFLAYRLDATRYFRFVGYYRAVLPLALLAGVSCGFILLAAVRTWNPNRHPLARALARFGPPGAAAEAVEADGPAVRLAGAWLAPRWLVYPGGTRPVVFRRDDLLACCEFVLQGDREVHGCRLVDCQGTCLTLTGPRAEIERLCAELSARAPWLVLGTGLDTAAAWERDLKTLAEVVRQRRRQGYQQPRHVLCSPPT